MNYAGIFLSNLDSLFWEQDKLVLKRDLTTKNLNSTYKKSWTSLDTAWTTIMIGAVLSKYFI